MTVLTTDWTGSIRSTAFGAGTNYPGLGGIGGLGQLQPTGARVQRAFDGSLAGFDRLPSRDLTIPFVILGTTPANTYANFRTLAAAWRRSRTDEIELDLRWPGAPGTDSTIRFYGRPMGISAPVDSLKSSFLQCLATFEATDPYGYGVAFSASDTAGTVTLSSGSMGDTEADTVPASIVITGNGGTPSLVSATDSGRGLAFTAALAAAHTYTIDLRTLAVLHDTTSDNAALAAGSGFALHGGVTNTLTLTGAASVALSIQPAFYI